MDLSVQVMGQIKPSLLLSHRPLQVAILRVDGHQTQQCCWITLLVLCICAAMLGVGAIGYSEPQGKHGQKLSCTLPHDM